MFSREDYTPPHSWKNVFFILKKSELDVSEKIRIIYTAHNLKWNKVNIINVCEYYQYLEEKCIDMRINDEYMIVMVVLSEFVWKIELHASLIILLKIIETPFKYGNSPKISGSGGHYCS